MTIVAGSAVGVLGLEGWSGFTVYIISQLLVSSKALCCCGSVSNMIHYKVAVFFVLRQ